MCEYEIWNFRKIEDAVIDVNEYNSLYSLWDFCLQELNSRQIALLLALEEGKSQVEIAKDWNVSKSSISQHLEDIRQKLRPYLKSRGMLKDE